ncbi:MAG: aminotransferase class V-fold PLP-dependent enzyme [Ignavibacteria bacterium]|nr:aminotransferase class V-fold PLP-dependent enzyme [Ignavibacteria bacterium]
MIYLNNAATSFPKPKEVKDAVVASFDYPLVHSSRTGFEREEEDIAYLCRVRLADLFNVEDPLRIVFTSGSTEALNLAIKGLSLDGSNVVITAIEHNSVIRPVKTLEKEGKISVTIVECNKNGYVYPEQIEKSIRDNTRAVIVNHCSNVTGAVLDLEKIAKIVHSRGAYLIVDASQSAGAIQIDCKNWDIDLLAFTGHKSLFGLQGIGGLYIKEGIELKPLKVGGTGILSEILLQPEGVPIHYEAGTPNRPGIISLYAGVQFILNTGLEKILEHKKKLYQILFDELEGNEDIEIYSPRENTSYSNFCFNVKKMVPEEVGYMLESSFDIYVRTGLHCAPLMLPYLGVAPWGTVRASHSYFTTEEEIYKFTDAIKKIALVTKKI